MAQIDSYPSASDAEGASLLGVQNGVTKLFTPDLIVGAVPEADDYASSTVSQTGLTGTTNLSGMTITFDVGSRPKWVVGYVPFAFCSTAPGVAVLLITDGSDVTKNSAGCFCVSTSDRTHVMAIEEITTPGNYTRKLRWQVNSGTWTVFGSATSHNRLYSTDRPPFG